MLASRIEMNTNTTKRVGCALRVVEDWRSFHSRDAWNAISLQLDQSELPVITGRVSVPLASGKLMGH
jgi:hypothetical protein